MPAKKAKQDTVAKRGEASDGGPSKRNAKAGEGCGKADISKMLGVLKYQASDGKNVTKKEEASKALAIYKTLADPAERHLFLKDFDGGKQGFKFAGKLLVAKNWL